MEVVTLVAAAAALAVASAIRIELPGGRAIVPVAAVGPAVFMLGPEAFAVTGLPALAASVVFAEAVGAAVRADGWRPAVLHGLLYAAGYGLSVAGATLFAGGRIGDDEPIEMVITVTVVSLVLLAGTLQGLDRRKRSLRTWNLRGVLPVALLVVSVANLLVLVYPLLGWPSFPVLVLPLVATRWEYKRFREAEQTYEETVSALGRLTEQAGYVPEGHHERVAEWVEALARELGIPEERIRELKLVALMHDVGAVSLEEGDAVAGHSQATAGLLQETGYLASWASRISEQGDISGQAEQDVEAQILAVANRLDEAAHENGPPDLDAITSACDAQLAAAVRRLAAKPAR